MLVRSGRVRRRRPATGTTLLGALLSVVVLASCAEPVDPDAADATADVAMDVEPAAAADVVADVAADGAGASTIARAADTPAESTVVPIPAGAAARSAIESARDTRVGHEARGEVSVRHGVATDTAANLPSTVRHTASAIDRMRAGRIRAVVSAEAADTDAAASTAPASASAPDPFDWRIPEWLPPPPVPDDNPMSEAKVRLGRHLFHDRRLSADDSVACASCHEQSLGFTDGRPFAVGIHGTEARRNAMGLANVGYSPVLTWSNPYLTSLERQSLVPLFGEEPEEMGMSGRESALFERLSTDPDYAPMFAKAFPEREGAVNLATITRALAAFQRTMISVGSDYDRYKYGGDASALDASALRGEMLFFSETAECYHCHQGFNFTDTLQTSRSAYPEVAFHNTGLYDIDGRGTYPPGQQGLVELSGRDEDMGRFRTPSLRNVAVTAPYFHDGSAATLDDVLDHYAAGGRTLEGSHAGVGRNNPLKDSLVKGFALDDGMRADLKAFLSSLTDEDFLTEPRFSNPWPEGHPAQGYAAEDLLGESIDDPSAPSRPRSAPSPQIPANDSETDRP